MCCVQVYSGAIDRVVGPGAVNTGDVIVVANANLVPMGWGVYNPVSMFTVR